MAIISPDASVVLNGTAITDFVEGDFIEINPVNDLTSHTNGAAGLVNINKRVDGDVHDLIVRVLKYSESDIFLNNLLNQESPALINGSVKEPYIQDGNDSIENWILENGSFTSRPGNTKNNQEGSNSQEYTIRFRSGTRLI